jgi:hypothetical protein
MQKSMIRQIKRGKEHYVANHLHANANSGMFLPPVWLAETLIRHVLWRDVTRGTFSAFRQVRFGNKIRRGLFLTNVFDRGPYL